MQQFSQLVVAGLLQGGILALLSIGLSLIFGVVRVVNFAQADFMMLGMYAVFFAGTLLAWDSTALALLVFVPFVAFGPLRAGVTTTAPVAPIDKAPLISAMNTVLASPSVKACAVDWRARNPNKLAQRVDVTFALAPGKASATFGGFLDEPLRACLAGAHMEKGFAEVVRDLPRPTELKGNIDLDLLAPL